MRNREVIEKDGTDKRQLQLEVLLDIRDLLKEENEHNIRQTNAALRSSPDRVSTSKGRK